MVRRSTSGRKRVAKFKRIVFKNLDTPISQSTLLSIIENHSKFNKTEYYKDLPVFEMTCDHDFPMEQTIVPIMKRKVISYIFQIVSMNKINNFDSK